MILRVGMFPYIFILFTTLTAGILQFFGDSEDAIRAEPVLQGSTEVCFPSGGVTSAEYTAGGNPTDEFEWLVTPPEGEPFGRTKRIGENRFTVYFIESGTYQVEVTVYRDGTLYDKKSLAVVVEEMTDTPTLIAPPFVLLCGDEPQIVQAISGDEANSGKYQVEWRENNEFGAVLSEDNEYEINDEGMYYVAVWESGGAGICKVQGWITAKPPIEFEVVPSATEVCLGQTVTYTPDTPISGSWFYQKEGQTSRTPLGKFYTLGLDTDNLEGTGNYTIFFNAVVEENPECSIPTKEFFLQVNEGPQLNLTKVSDAEDCDAPTGTFQISTSTGLTNVRVEGVPGAVFSQIDPGASETVSGLVPKIYRVTGTLNGCTITRVINIENKSFEAIDFKVSRENPVCTDDGSVVTGSVTLHFPEPKSGQYSFLRLNGPDISGTFTNEEEIKIEGLPSGRYDLVVWNEDDCSFPAPLEVEITAPPRVLFSVPNEMTICESFKLIPESPDPNLYPGLSVAYTLTDPAENPIPWDDEIGGFHIKEAGTYTILGQDDDSELCAREQKIEVKQISKVDFKPVPRYINCDHEKELSLIYIAELGEGVSFDEVDTRWWKQVDKEKDIWEPFGAGKEFFPSGGGWYYLDVQPIKSGPCETQPELFFVEFPDPSAEVSIDATPYCGEDSFSTLTAEFPGDIEAVFIRWFYIDAEGNETELAADLANPDEIEVTEEGDYRVQILNRGEQDEPDCELGQASYTLGRAERITLNLNDEYQICSAENRWARISATGNCHDEGEFIFIWKEGATELGRGCEFTFNRPGEFELVVFDGNSCLVNTTTFMVVDTCKELARFPNAIMPGDPEKDFRIYVDPMIENVEAYIYNRSGQLIYHCSSDVQEANQAVCIWDGLIDGKRASIGTYPVIIYVNSTEHQIREEIKKSILVVE